MNTSNIPEAIEPVFSTEKYIPEIANSKWIQDLEATKDIDGAVLVNYQLLKTILHERAVYKQDVQFTVGTIKRLLTQLGILTASGELRFKFSGLVKSLNKVLWSQEAAAEEFKYLGDLEGIIDKYKDV